MPTQKGFSTVFLLVVLAILVGSVGVYLATTETPEENNIPREEFPNPVDETGDEPGSDLANQKTYVSKNLGISFKYLEVQYGEKVLVKETGNKIYVYVEKMTPEDGQYLEVFYKKPSEPLLSAINNKFLSGYSVNDCEVSFIDPSWQYYPENFKLANIKVKGTWNDLDEFAVLYEKCPRHYTASNGISYFLSNETRPDKYLFISIGQYAIWADESDPNMSWQDTIKFLD